jgi:type II secretory ATPase GspE/PulE/Tfp pilus assembly ATPase PilB-like protein
LGRVPQEFGRRWMAHIKSLANMDITERRRPLDGRLIFESSDRPTVDMRINTIPTLYGEDFTLRILDRTNRLLQLDQLGLIPHDFNYLAKMLSSPSGLLLFTGPTGAGKTTTLYSCLQHLNNGERKINSIEDPIEYALTGVRQSQVNPKTDVGFAELLRSVLRQAPDVIMIGEIRDAETAEIAVRAANSGHLVLATLHAPATSSAVQAMMSFGVPVYYLASSLLGVISQRLVRTLNPQTKVAYGLDMHPGLFDEVRLWLGPDQKEVIFGPNLEPSKKGQAYTGRMGIFEVLLMSEGIRQLIMSNQPAQRIREKAIQEGMVEVRQGALLAIARGETSVEEVFRAIPAEYL